jgi:CubicO group peptidase (beta-lactamase class C family)
MDTSGLPAFLDEQQFSGVVIVRRGGTTLFEGAAGFATPKWQVPNTLDTRFDTASITKLFTSVAALQLVAAGELDLETSIHHYADLEGTAIPAGVTLLHLLTHTSGIADDADEEAGESYDELYREVPSYAIEQTSDALRLFAHKPPVAEPGTVARYSNAGYVLVGLAIERVTGRPYRQVVADAVFQRAGMADSGFWDRRDAVPLLAEGWDRNDDGSWTAALFASPPVGGPDGGAQTTADDLLRFIDAVRDGRLLDREFTEEFFVPQVEADDDTDYGFGLEFDIDDDGAVRSYYKDGIGAGASGILRHYPQQGVDVVVLANSEEGAWPVVQELDDRIEG